MNPFSLQLNMNSPNDAFDGVWQKSVVLEKKTTPLLKNVMDEDVYFQAAVMQTRFEKIINAG